MFEIFKEFDKMFEKFEKMFENQRKALYEFFEEQRKALELYAEKHPDKVKRYNLRINWKTGMDKPEIIIKEDSDEKAVEYIKVSLLKHKKDK